ncbi:uncharacterized protein LOC144100229 [Amblyomma americanum]
MASTSMLFLAVAMLCAAAATAGEDTEPSGGTGLQGRQEEAAEIVEALGELIEAIPTLSPRDSGSPPPLGLVATPSPEFLESRRTRQPSHPPVHTPPHDEETEPRGGAGRRRWYQKSGIKSFMKKALKPFMRRFQASPPSPQQPSERPVHIPAPDDAGQEEK